MLQTAKGDLNSTFIQWWIEKEVGLRRRDSDRERRGELEEEKEWEKRVCYVKRGDFSHVIADSASQPSCTQIYYFTRAWKTQQIKLWSVCLLEMDIFILDFGFSSLKSAFEIVSHPTVAGLGLHKSMNPFLFEVSEQVTAANFMILSFLLSGVIPHIYRRNNHSHRW